MVNDPMRISALGEFLIVGPHGRIDIQLSQTARSLLVGLVSQSRALGREELAARYWPDAEPSRARASLSTTLWTIRTGLRDAIGIEPLETSRDRIALTTSVRVELDVTEFEAAIARRDDVAAEAAYGGPYLDGNFEDDVIAERERLATLYEAVLARLLTVDPDPERARRLVAADPYAEIAYRVLVDATLGDASDTSAARTWLRRARTAFAEIDAIPTFFSLSPYRSLLEFDDDRTPRTNLTSEATSFVGRLAEETALTAAFRVSRVVTIVGAGGCGKTRLARQFAARALGTTHRAVWFVDLSSAAGEDAVVSAIATTLGLRNEQRRGAHEIVAEALRDSDALLAIDNCEHLIDEVAAVVSETARNAPRVQILATSREALEIEAEVVVRLGGLAVEDATELFLTRARASDRRLVLSDAARESGRQIAAALDGLPLALELAAARVRIDGLSAIADDALRFTRNAVGPRDRTPRSQTIAASIAWSVERLDPASRALFGRLGQFAGSFDARDAARLDLDDSGALDGLVARSLVVRADSSDFPFRFLGPLRDDARRRLESDPRREDARTAHAACVIENVDALCKSRGGDAGASSERRLDELGADIEMALDRTLARGDSSSAIDTIVKLGYHWAARTNHAVAERWFARASEAARDDRRRGDLAYIRAGFASNVADYEAALRLGHTARKSYAAAGAPDGEIKSWTLVASCLISLQRIEEAKAALERCLAGRHLVTDESVIAAALMNVGIISADTGDYERALRAFEECSHIFDRVSSRQSRVRCYSNIALVRALMGDHSRADDATARAIEHAEASGNGPTRAFAFSNAAFRCVTSREFERADEFARRVGEIPDAPQIFVGYALLARAAAACDAGEQSLAHRFGSAARAIDRDGARFEKLEAQLLATVPGREEDAVERNAREYLTLLAKPTLAFARD